jgi:hypothetical protein
MAQGPLLFGLFCLIYRKATWHLTLLPTEACGRINAIESTGYSQFTAPVYPSQSTGSTTKCDTVR